LLTEPDDSFFSTSFFRDVAEIAYSGVVAEIAYSGVVSMYRLIGCHFV